MTPQEEIINIELSVLKALCQGSLAGPEAARIRAGLAGYVWREPVHQVVFRALVSIHFTDPKIIRDLLPARLTLYGFPDVKFEDLFEPYPVSPDAVQHLIERLLQNG